MLYSQLKNTYINNPETTQDNLIQVYPSFDRNVWGPHAWHILHEFAATYPEHPKSTEKNDYRLLFKLFVKHLPCKECASHGIEYLKEHPLNNTVMSDNRNFFNYICQFHNHVNRRKGKRIVDCAKIFDPDGQSKLFCEDCYRGKRKENSKNNDSKTVEDVIKNDVQSTMTEFRDLSIELFEELCHNDNIPVPKINFGVCPTSKTASCVDNRDDKNTTVYLNPISTSLRSILHEYRHYYNIKKGNDRDKNTEEDANRFAIEKIVNSFEDSFKTKKTFPHNEIYNDEIEDQTDLLEKTRDTTENISNVDENIASRKVERLESVDKALDNSAGESDFTSSFPMYSEVRQRTLQRRQMMYKERAEGKGLLSHFDGILGKPAKWTGVMEQDLGLFHISLIIKDLVILTLESNTTPFGAAVISFLIGALLIGGSMVFKKNLNYRDLQLVHLVGASFVWNTISYLNPKIKTTFKNDAKKAIAAVKSGNFRMAGDYIFETPKKYKKKLSIAGLTGGTLANPVSPFAPSIMRAKAMQGNTDTSRIFNSIASTIPADSATRAAEATIGGGGGVPINTGGFTDVEIGRLNAQPSPYTTLINPGNLSSYLTPDRYSYESNGDQYYDDLYNFYLGQYGGQAPLRNYGNDTGLQTSDINVNVLR